MIPALIAGGAALAGAAVNYFSNKNSQENQNAIAQANINQQREFAQNGVRWKVEDARAAGVHPLFALGANTHSFSPVSVGGGSSHDVGDAISSAGQNIGRAVQAGMTAGERQKSQAADLLTLERAGLENELLRTQILVLKKPPGQPPAMPTLGPSPAGFPVKTDDIKQTPDDMPETARIYPMGIPMKTNKNFSDAEKVENRYSNVVENISGLVNLLADAEYTYSPMVKEKIRQLYQRVMADDRRQHSHPSNPFSRSYERR